MYFYHSGPLEFHERSHHTKNIKKSTVHTGLSLKLWKVMSVGEQMHLTTFFISKTVKTKNKVELVAVVLLILRQPKPFPSHNQVVVLKI